MLNSINCILYASDFGPDSRKGFRMAVNLARTHGARLIFMHVIKPLGKSAEMMINSYLNEGQQQKMETKGVEAIREIIQGRIQTFAKEELNGDYQLSNGGPEYRIEQGNAVEQILAVSEEVRADLIVMGSRTHSAISQVMVGSTAHTLLYRSTRPVLIVPMGDSEKE